MGIRVDIRKRLDSFDLEVAFETERETLGILGASGSGKSMTLRCIAGIERPDEGVITVDGLTVFDSASGIDLAPRDRCVGLLFQHYALFPTMSVAGNIDIAISARFGQGLPRAQRAARVAELVGMFRLEGLEDSLPARLSGGQQQRVALARMIASAPRAILLDEPFSALDGHLRAAIERDLVSFLDAVDVPSLLVSHNRDEVFRLCPSVIALDEGRITAAGSRERVFADPRTVAAARLTGCENIAPAIRAGRESVAIPSWGVVLETAQAIPKSMTHVGIRARDIHAASDRDTCNRFPFSVDRVLASPETVTLNVTALTAPGVAGGERSVRESLVWERRLEDGTAEHRVGKVDLRAGKRNGEISLAIPPDAVLFLS